MKNEADPTAEFPPHSRGPQPASRREFLKIGSLGFGGLTLTQLLPLRAAAESEVLAKPRSIVLLFLEGGPSQLETFDPKPDASSEYRSPLGSIKTSLPGVEFGSLFPKMAGLANKMSVVRSFTHGDGDHGGAAHWVKTGHPWPPPFFGQAGLRVPQFAPSIGSVVSRARGTVHPQMGVPAYVCVRTVPGYEGDEAAWFGQAFAPFRLGTTNGTNTMLSNMTLKVSRERLNDRLALLSSFDRMGHRLDTNGNLQALDDLRAQALRVVVGKAKHAFDLSLESDRLRDKFGPGLGQELLMARRLCEAGVSFVTINNSYSGDIDGWDHHKKIVSSCQTMCPPVDHAVSVFIEDLYARGLDKDVLLIIAGEFGRTPRLNKDAGRDHWAPLGFLVFVGGGLNMGRIIGESDAKAAYPKSRPVSPQDLMATCFRVLGIDQELQFVGPGGRPAYMIYEGGKPIEELF